MENVKENIPLCDIRIDRDGVWYFRGAVMFRKEIVNYFYEHLRLDEEGRYWIDLGHDCCVIDVEDTPFVVRAVYRSREDNGNGERIDLLLCDDTLELLDPASLSMTQENVPYCSVRGGRFPARFSRPAYYQLAEHIEYDARRDAFYLSLNGQAYDLLQRKFPEI
ncbi:MAG TPA: DUF1285 domain-containing protein [Syntrophales bacterium]|jgi:hypothetical protein|nr:DUF1285 domain-containing protein [Syntrophales bacterium]